MFCVKCGAENADNSKFCRKCGAPLRKVNAENLTPSNVVTSPPAASSDARQPAEHSPVLPPNIAGLLCYLFGWVSGVVFLVIERNNRFIRFHAWQSILASVFLSIVIIVPAIVAGAVTFTSMALAITLVGIYWIVVIFAVFVWILLMVKAYRGRDFRLPVIGNIAWQLSQK